MKKKSEEEMVLVKKEISPPLQYQNEIKKEISPPPKELLPPPIVLLPPPKELLPPPKEIPPPLQPQNEIKKEILPPSPQPQNETKKDMGTLQNESNSIRNNSSTNSVPDNSFLVKKNNFRNSILGKIGILSINEKKIFKK